MKFNELKENFETKENYKPKLQVKTFIGFMDKVILIEELKQKCIDIDSSGLYTIDYLTKSMVMDLFFVKNCSNIELDESEGVSMIDQYDFLTEKRIVESVLSKIKIDREYEYIKLVEWCDKTLEQEISVKNSIEGIIANGIHDLIDKVPNEKELQKIVKSIKDINPKKFKMITDLFNFSKNKSEDVEKAEKAESPKKE